MSLTEKNNKMFRAKQFGAKYFRKTDVILGKL